MGWLCEKCHKNAFKEGESIMVRLFLSKFKWLLPLYCRIRPYLHKRLFFSIFCRRLGMREMIVCEDDFCVMGGLCDRLNGIVSMYKYCKENDIPFKINFVKPFDLHNYLVPNKYDWTVDFSKIDYLHSHLRYIPMMDIKWRDFEHYFSTQTKYVKKMIKDWGNGTLICWSNAHLVRKEEFSTLFEELFRPSKVVQDEIDANLKNVGGPYIGITVRFQNRLGDFKEANVKPLSNEEKKELINRCRDKILEIHNAYPQKKILVTSDSRTFLDYMDVYEFVYTIPGKLIHMEYSFENGIDAYIKGFVDLLMLSKADALYLLITGNMWRSSFSETASYIGNCDYFDIRF